jgi:hypothetical protein
MQPLTDEQCLADPETRKFEEALVALFEDDKSPLLVRVEFDPQAAIGAVCADRTSEPRQTLSRIRLGKQFFSRAKSDLAGEPGQGRERIAALHVDEATA